GYAGRTRARAVALRRHPAEGVVLWAAVARDRRDQVDRGQVSRARGLHDPLGRGPPGEGVQGAAPLVRARRDARVPDALSAHHRPKGIYPSRVFPPRAKPPRDGIFAFHALVPVVGIPRREIRAESPFTR